MSKGGPRPGKSAGAGGGTRLWRTLAAAGREAIAEALTEEDFERLHIESGIERFLGEQVKAGRSVVVTGNAGDGKTHLLRRVKHDLQSAGAVVVEDATAEMRGGDPGPILEKWRAAIEGGQPFCLAANEYPLYQLRMADVSAPHLVEVGRQCQDRLAYGDAEDPRCAGNVLVVDLSLRNPLGREFFDSMLDKLLDDEGVKAALTSSAEAEAVVRANVECLDHPQVRERLRALAQRMVALGHRATVRELWILFARMVFGTVEHGEYQRTDWYSEALFDRDERFDLTEVLQAVDPAGCSHPVWDAALDDRGPEVREGWVVREPVTAPHPTLDWDNFAALKRRFYFEHDKGDEVFALADADAREFEDLVQGRKGSGRTLVASLVDAINAAYCPRHFDARDQHLYLWNGHRFHEQPSRSFVAAERVASDDLVAEVPRLPARLEGCFDYHPDHIALTARSLSGTPRLRIDFPLWRTLCRLTRGLPRKLIPERDIHRLDAFLQKLGAGTVGDRDCVWSVHLENLELIQVNLSADRSCFERVRRYG